MVLRRQNVKRYPCKKYKLSEWTEDLGLNGRAKAGELSTDKLYQLEAVGRSRSDRDGA